MKKYLKILYLVLPLLFFIPSISVFAAEDDSVYVSQFYGVDFSGYSSTLNVTDFGNSALYAPYDTHFGTYGPSSTLITWFDGNVNNGELSISQSYDIDGNTYNISDFPYFFVMHKSGEANAYLLLVDNTEDFYVISNSRVIGNDYSFNFISLLFNVNNGSISSVGYSSFSNGSSYDKQIFTNYGVVLSNSDCIRLVPASITWASAGYNAGNYFRMLYEYENSGLIANYMLYDSEGNLSYNNPILNPSSGGESTANNLYMNNPNWQFRNIPSFGSLLDTNSKGQAIFSGQLTDYQKQNLDKFRLDFTFNTFWNGATFSIGSDDVTQVRHDFSKSFLYQIQVPLSDFYSGGSLYSFYIDDIFANSLSNDTDQTLADWADYYIHEYNHNTDSFRTAFTVNLISLDNSGQSGSCTAYYSYKTGTSQTTNNSMGINTNPYVDDEGSASGVTDPTQDPSGDGSGSGVGNVGDGSIVNNNNPVININNNNSLSDGDSDGLISKILLMIANNQSATSSGIEEIADTSGFVELMGATWLAVPTSWWTTLTAAFIASIGILVVGFIIKIIIGLIF